MYVCIGYIVDCFLFLPANVLGIISLLFTQSIELNWEGGRRGEKCLWVECIVGTHWGEGEGEFKLEIILAIESMFAN